MGAGCGSRAARAILIIINFTVWIVSLGLIGIGIWMFVEVSRFEEILAEENITPVAGMLLGLGFVCFLVGFCGCCGAKKENICFLKMYFTLMLIVILGEITCGILLFVYRSEIEDSLRKGMTHTITNNYGKTEAATESVDRIQTKFTCCGANNYTDYTESYYQDELQHGNGSLPDSCCTPATTDTNCSYSIDTKNTEGCVSASISTIENNMTILAAICFGVVIFEILAMLFSCCMINALKKELASLRMY